MRAHSDDRPSIIRLALAGAMTGVGVAALIAGFLVFSSHAPGPIEAQAFAEYLERPSLQTPTAEEPEGVQLAYTPAD